LNYENDRDQFALMMKVTWQSYGRNGLERETMRYWFDKLINYEFDEVSKAFDLWIKSQKELPTVSDILKLCQHKVTIHARLPSPLSQESNQAHAKEVVQYVAEHIKAPIDRRQWARDLISGKKISNWDGAINFAKEALKMPLV
jgi:hypothetical protein